MFSSPSDIYAAPGSSLVILSMIGEQPPRVLYGQCLIGWLIRPHNLCWESCALILALSATTFVESRVVNQRLIETIRLLCRVLATTKFKKSARSRQNHDQSNKCMQDANTTSFRVEARLPKFLHAIKQIFDFRVQYHWSSLCKGEGNHWRIVQECLGNNRVLNCLQTKL